MRYDDWHDDVMQELFVDYEYDRWMADAYNTCIANDWYFPEEVLMWFKVRQAGYVQNGNHPSTAEAKVVKEYGLDQSPWYFYHMNGGAKRWNASPDAAKTSTRIPELVGTVEVEVRASGLVRTADLGPGEVLDVLTPRGSVISVRNISKG